LIPSILVAFLAIGCAADNSSSTNASGESLESRPIPDVAADHDGLLTLLAALDEADLIETLASDGPFTLFAPTDEAFAKIPKEALDALLADPEALRDVLLYHVVADDLTAADVLASSSLTTVQGGTISVQAENATLNGMVNLIETDIIAENGVIHLIDMVLMPMGDDGMGDPDIVEIAGSDERFSTLVTALGVAELVETLQGEGPFTVFAPTDEAFAKLPEGTLEALVADPDALREILLYHVVPGDLRATDVLAATTLTTAQGDVITVDAESVTLNGNTGLVQTDIVAANGVIHAIDMVLLPPEPEPTTIVDIAVSDERFSTLVTALGVAELVETLQGEGPFTVFAPTNEAFAKLPEGTLDALLHDADALREILLYHVVPGDLRAADVLAATELTTAQGDVITVDAESVTLNGNTGLVQTDIVADNGVIHAIDMVLLPPEPEPTTIVDIAVSDERFSTLVTALGVAELVETLQGEGPFTVFAPTNEAFAKLPEGTLDALLHDADALREILLYHVVPGDLRAADVLAATELTTAQGDVITVDAESVTLNGNTGLVQTDIVADNGVIHAIDMVLLPPEPKTVVDIAVEDGRFHTLVRALEKAHLVETLQGEGPFTVFAPTDEAFDKLPKVLLHALFLYPSSLRALLLYHVVPGDLDAGDVLAAEALKTLQGASFSVEADHPSLNGSVGFVETDIKASNGVVHVIDGVLIPPVH
jgi:transforming growth factor-beta-induced protein